MTKTEDRVAERLRREADSYEPSDRRQQIRERLRTGERRSLARHPAVLVLALAVALAVAIPVLAAQSGPHGVGRTTIPPATTGPTTTRPPSQPTVRLVHLFAVEPTLMAATGSEFAGISLPSNSAPRAVMIAASADGHLVRRNVTMALADYLSVAGAQGRSLYVATSVIARFSKATNEVMLLSTSTGKILVRVSVPGDVDALAVSGQGVFVALADEILRLDPTTLARLATYEIPGATPPPFGSSMISSLALGPGGLLVTFGDSTSTVLDRFDPSTLTLLGQTAVPESGQGIRVEGDGTAAWLTGEGFARLVGPTGALGPAVSVPELVAAAAWRGDLLALVTTGPANEDLVVLSAAGHVVTRAPVGDAGEPIAVADDYVWLLDGTRLACWTLDGVAG